MDQTLLHVALPDDLERARRTGRYRAASLEAEGFLHCCDPDQLDGVLRRWFAGAADVVLLRIDPAKLDAPLVRENTSGAAEPFPHVYGEIPLAAIAGVELLGVAPAAAPADALADASGDGGTPPAEPPSGSAPAASA